MINCKEFYEALKENDLTFFTGVPDSLLKDFSGYINNNATNIIAANEGNAVALALGYHLSTNKIPTVYMQNSGLGNAINPLVSLAHKEVYSIPMLLFIGWRGEPGKKDEPQHIAKGKITLSLLKTLGIKYEILPENLEDANIAIKNSVSYMKKKNLPYAIVVKKGTFEEYKPDNAFDKNFELTREDALKIIVPILDKKDAVVSTTGKLSRELFELRESRNESHNKDFLTVGGMGHASSIALGIALQKSDRNIYCFDGDGALIMHMGALSTIGMLKPKNFKHVIFNNFVHDSVGGQPTAASFIDFKKLAKSNGYNKVFLAKNSKQLEKKFKKLKKSEGPSLLVININKGSRSNLGRPNKSPVENKEDLMEFLKE